MVAVKTMRCQVGSGVIIVIFKLVLAFPEFFYVVSRKIEDLRKFTYWELKRKGENQLSYVHKLR